MGKYWRANCLRAILRCYFLTIGVGERSTRGREVIETEIVAMFCGPHSPDGGQRFERIDMATRTALTRNLPLVIAGDGNHGEDLKVFEGVARSDGVRLIVTLYDRQANTLADAQLVANAVVTDARFRGVRRIYLVTAGYHMIRATTMLRGELKKLVSGPPIEVIEVEVPDEEPQDGQVVNEALGLQHYLAGDYGDHNRNGDHVGKPARSNEDGLTVVFDARFG